VIEGSLGVLPCAPLPRSSSRPYSRASWSASCAYWHAKAISLKSPALARDGKRSWNLVPRADEWAENSPILDRDSRNWQFPGLSVLFLSTKRGVYSS